MRNFDKQRTDCWQYYSETKNGRKTISYFTIFCQCNFNTKDYYHMSLIQILWDTQM